MLWAYTEQLKQIGCDQETSGRVDFAGAREVQIAELVGCGFLKDCVVVSQIGCVTCGERVGRGFAQRAKSVAEVLQHIVHDAPVRRLPEQEQGHTDVYVSCWCGN